MSDTLRGQVLIATKPMRDPNFFKTVVLIIEHGDQGTMGVVINRPSSVPVSDALGEHFDFPPTEDLIFVGGPVEPQGLFVIHNAIDLAEEERPVVPDVYVGANPEIFEDVVQAVSEGNTDLLYRVFSGCAGWSPGQLEGELDRGDWYLHPADAEDIFTEDPYSLWDETLQQFYISNRLLPHLTPNPEWN